MTINKKRFTDYLNDRILKDKIQYIPWIDISELPGYLSKVDFCVAPFVVNDQHESGIANKIFQYMYGRKAIIASNCKPQANLIIKYNCGIVYTNDQEFVDAIINLVGNPELTRSMGKSGYQALLDDYNLDKLKVDFLNAFRENK